MLQTGRAGSREPALFVCELSMHGDAAGMAVANWNLWGRLRDRPPLGVRPFGRKSVRLTTRPTRGRRSIVAPASCRRFCAAWLCVKPPAGCRRYDCILAIVWILLRLLIRPVAFMGRSEIRPCTAARHITRLQVPSAAGRARASSADFRSCHSHGKTGARCPRHENRGQSRGPWLTPDPSLR